MQDISSLLDLLAGLSRVLEERTALQSTRLRDRKLGQTIEDLKGRPVEQLAAWLERLRPEQDRSLGTVFGIAQTMVALLGLFLGASAARLILFYDGTRPVNILHFLVLFVLLPLLLLLPTLFAFLPLGRFEAGRSLEQRLLSLSPGRLERFILRSERFGISRALEKALAGLARHHALFSGIENRLILYFSQLFSAAFFSAVLAASLYTFTIADVAFSWSSTLPVESEDLGALARVLSCPWRLVFPKAVPTKELIEKTRFFRLQGAERALSPDPAVFGQWWSFLLLCVFVYALLPRIALAVAARIRLHSMAVKTILSLPGVEGVLHDLNSPALATAAGIPPRTPTGKYRLASEVGELPPGGGVLVAWNAAALSDSSLQALSPEAVTLLKAPHFQAGAGLSYEEEEAMLDELRRRVGPRNILVAVRAWEPPTAEFADFLKSLRAVLAKTHPVFLLLIFFEHDEKRANDINAWSGFISRLGDPWVKLSLLE